MRTQTKLAIGVVMVLVATLAVVLSTRSDDAGPTQQVAPEQDSVLVRDDSHVLGEPGTGGVTLVEFLDFECEACGAAYPIIEDLRTRYAGQVTFVARYFPLPGHVNSRTSARAVEAASRQGEFEAMYRKMYETQATWGEQQEPLDGLFRTYAEELGLDMEQYDTDYASPEVAARVEKDVADGTELGIQGTPTFYLNGALLQPRSGEDFVSAIDAALAE